ncbi:zonular occludens toxin domain-containing protein [Dyella soli]|uniref:Zona occludens toxin N-terminal domain-containing protein n=1 Tax=Dyella soli TaxID=522319 RepID=A0A4R0YUY7_9GAMM|nr:zonular occludens toxin domain-containing protein [Dyella soli]TCI10130.1 hypothetical protein EZM97_14520 [Dyella soli]
MPIEFRSGLPGAGKTLGAVEHLMHLRKHAPERPVYALGITDLRDGLALPLGEDQLRRWQELPAGAIVVVDECQKWMPARRGAAESPQWIKDLSTHRHLGLDFILISQHASLIDPYVRKLVSRHIHTVRVFGTEWVERWEWPECQSDPTSSGAKKLCENKSRHKYSRDAMASYKSAELHTVKPRVPKFLKIAAALLVIIPILGAAGYYAMHHAANTAGSSDGPSGSTVSLPHGPSAPKDADEELRRTSFATWMKPRVDGLPWSAPMFDHLEVKATPQLFCVAVDDGRCTCHTEQGTRYAVPADRCRQIVADGLYNPFVDGSSTAGRRGDGDFSRQSRSRGDAGQQVAREGGYPDTDGGGMHERATAKAYTPPEFHVWNSDPFGSVKGK